MATTKKTNYVKGVTPMPAPTGSEVISVFDSVALAVTDIELADVVQLFVLPAGCVPVDYVIGATDMDTNAAPTLAANFGLLNAAETAISTAADDGGAAWIAALAMTGTAAITLSTVSKAAFDVLKAVKPSSVNRIVALVISTAAATAATGTVECEFSYRAA